LEPVPETRRALDEFMEPDEGDLSEVLQVLARTVRAIVPECVGLSLCLVREGLTFTLVATDEEIAEVDSVQYVDGGPCVLEDPRRARDAEEVVMDALLDEHRWTLYAQASAAAGIASSLSLTLTREGEVIGGINLYAATPEAFTGHHDELTSALGADAGSAVRDADLSFETRRAAAHAPEQLRDQLEIETAVGMLAARYHESTEDAHQRLSNAASRAGLTQVTVARVLALLHLP
jgi:GAF domain-containing protein